MLLRHSGQGLRQSCWLYWEIAGCGCVWLACCIGKIRWHGGVVEDWGVRGGFLDPSLSTSFSFLKWIGLEQTNTIHSIFSLGACAHAYLSGRRNKKEGENVSGKVVPCTCICVCFIGNVLNPQRKKSLFSYLSLCFKGGWKQSSNGICSQGALEPNQHLSGPNGPQKSFCGEGSLMPITPNTHIHAHQSGFLIWCGVIKVLKMDIGCTYEGIKNQTLQKLRAELCCSNRRCRPVVMGQLKQGTATGVGSAKCHWQHKRLLKHMQTL